MTKWVAVSAVIQFNPLQESIVYMTVYRFCRYRRGSVSILKPIQNHIQHFVYHWDRLYHKRYREPIWDESAVSAVIQFNTLVYNKINMILYRFFCLHARERLAFAFKGKNSVLSHVGLSFWVIMYRAAACFLGEGCCKQPPLCLPFLRKLTTSRELARNPSRAGPQGVGSLLARGWEQAQMGCRACGEKHREGAWGYVEGRGGNDMLNRVNKTIGNM